MRLLRSSNSAGVSAAGADPKRRLRRLQNNISPTYRSLMSDEEAEAITLRPMRLSNISPGAEWRSEEV